MQKGFEKRNKDYVKLSIFMKTHIISLRHYLVVILLFMGLLNAHGQNKHVGLWQGEDDISIGYLKLDENGYAMLIVRGDTLGGSQFEINGMKTKLTYLVDYNNNPKTIDLVLTFLENNQEYKRLVGIFSFKGNERMMLRLNFKDTKRPNDFLPKGNRETMIFTRVEE